MKNSLSQGNSHRSALKSSFATISMSECNPKFHGLHGQSESTWCDCFTIQNTKITEMTWPYNIIHNGTRDEITCTFFFNKHVDLKDPHSGSASAAMTVTMTMKSPPPPPGPPPRPPPLKPQFRSLHHLAFSIES